MITQIQLGDEEERALKALAAAKQLSIEELIHQSIDDLIQSATEMNRAYQVTVSPEEMAERRRRALAAVGRYHSGLSDISTEHDKYLVEDL